MSTEFVTSTTVRSWLQWSLKIPSMSFASKTWSSDTLIRGLGIVDKASGLAMSELADPDPAALEAELQRLLVSWINSGGFRIFL